MGSPRVPYLTTGTKKRYYLKCETNVANKGKGCGKLLAVHTIQYIQTHWYVSPYSCTGGDYWNEGEGDFICPKCSYRNRLRWSGVGRNCVEADPKRVRFENMQNQFHSIIEEYADRCNNPQDMVYTVIPVPGDKKKRAKSC